MHGILQRAYRLRAVLCEVIGEPIKRLEKLIGEPIKLAGKRALRKGRDQGHGLANGSAACGQCSI